jgi:hypothetical protein
MRNNGARFFWLAAFAATENTTPLFAQTTCAPACDMEFSAAQLPAGVYYCMLLSGKSAYRAAHVRGEANERIFIVQASNTLPLIQLFFVKGNRIG